MKKQKTNLYSVSLRGFWAALFILTVTGFALAQTYQIKVKGSGRYLHEDGGGDKLVSTRYQPNDDFTKFIFERQSDGSYRIRGKASGRYLHEDGGGDKLVSTRYQPGDDFTRYLLVSQGSGTYRIKVKASGRFLHEDGGGDKLVSTRYQPNDDFTRFILEPVNESGKAQPVNLSFTNRTTYPLAIYWVNAGTETFYQTLGVGGSYSQPTYNNHQWRVRLNGKLVGTYLATGSAAQRIRITIRTVEAGPIWDQPDAEQKCSALSRSTGEVWTGQWRTTIQGQMSVCELARLNY